MKAKKETKVKKKSKPTEAPGIPDAVASHDGRGQDHWCVYCRTCGKTLDSAPNGALMEGVTRNHLKDNPTHVAMLGCWYLVPGYEEQDTRIEQLQGQLSQALRAKHSMSEEVRDQAEELIEVRTQVAKLDDQNQKFRNELTELREKLRKSSHVAHRAQLDRYQDTAELRRSNENLCKHYDNARREIEGLQVAINNLKAKPNDETVREATERALEAARAALAHEAKLRADNQWLAKERLLQVDALTQRLVDAAAVSHARQRQVDAFRIDLRERNEEAEMLSERVHKLEVENYNLRQG